MYKAMSLKTGFDVETRELHQLSKEWLALREDLVAFHSQLGFLRDAHNELLGLKTKAANWHIAGRNDASNLFVVLVSQADICSRWTMVYRDRTDICIQMVSQWSSRLLSTVRTVTNPSS